MGEVNDAFYERVLRNIKGAVNDVTMKACFAWQAAEGGTAAFNPWDTEQPADGATDYNTDGVKNYPDWNTGVVATTQTLENGRYGPILEAFRAGTSGLAICRAVDLSPWGTKSAEAVYRSRFPDAP